MMRHDAVDRAHSHRERGRVLRRTATATSCLVLSRWWRHQSASIKFEIRKWNLKFLLLASSLRRIRYALCYVRWLFTFEAVTRCAHRIKRAAIILRNCHKTRLFDLPLSPSIGIKHLRVKRFLMIIAPSDRNWGNVGFSMFPRTPPTSDQWWSPPNKSFPL